MCDLKGEIQYFGSRMNEGMNEVIEKNEWINEWNDQSEIIEKDLMYDWMKKWMNEEVASSKRKRMNGRTIGYGSKWN